MGAKCSGLIAPRLAGGSAAAAAQRCRGVQQRGQGRRADAARGAPQEGPSVCRSLLRWSAFMGGLCGEHGAVGVQSRVIVSCRFSSTRATRGPGGQFGRRQVVRRRAIAHLQQLLGGLGVGRVLARGASRSSGRQHLRLARRRRAAKAWRKAHRKPLGRGRAPFADHPRGQHAGRLDVGRVVQQHQRLQRRVRPRPLHGALLAASRRRRPAGSGAGTSAASTCRARGGTGSRRGRLRTRASGSSGYAQ